LSERLKRQIEFILEVDKVKSIFRKTKLFDKSRHENDAEHSWHLGLMAIILLEYSNIPIDALKVLKMVLIHDIVEIDSGDYIVYTEQTAEKELKEKAAAERIFGMLPAEQKAEFISIWKEFEQRSTPEAKFATALDRLEPVMQNYYTEADAWRDNKISADQILAVNERIEMGSMKLWEYAKDLIDECIDKGLIS